MRNSYFYTTYTHARLATKKQKRMRNIAFYTNIRVLRIYEELELFKNICIDGYKRTKDTLI